MSASVLGSIVVFAFSASTRACTLTLSTSLRSNMAEKPTVGAITGKAAKGRFPNLNASGVLSGVTTLHDVSTGRVALIVLGIIITVMCKSAMMNMVFKCLHFVSSGKLCYAFFVVCFLKYLSKGA
jgi:hypothetical protein